jgi:DNA repair protein RadC
MKKKILIRSIRPVFEDSSIVAESELAYRKDARYTSAEQVVDLFRSLQDEAKEFFCCLHIDGKNRILCFEIVSIGTLNQSMVHPREVFKTALLSSAAAIILVHNHPSGDPSPSREDIDITKRLKEAGELLGIKLIDHIIIGKDSFYAFTTNGLL